MGQNTAIGQLKKMDQFYKLSSSLSLTSPTASPASLLNSDKQNVANGGKTTISSNKQLPGFIARDYNIYLRSSLVLFAFSLSSCISALQVWHRQPPAPLRIPKEAGTVRMQTACSDPDRSQVPSCRCPCISLWSHRAVGVLAVDV